MKLNGWNRIGIILSVLWMLSVIGYTAIEFQLGPESNMLLVDMVVTKTGEPIKVLEGNPFRDLVPVEPNLKLMTFFLALFIPVVVIWILSYLIVWSTKWVKAGFKE